MNEDGVFEDDEKIEEADDTIIEGDEDETTEDNSTGPERFDISSYGWDVDVEGLVKRMNRGDIYVPGFQRGFVWSGPEKSRFIESLILGLPVPTLFLARDSETQNQLNIIDGQQRLKTLQAYLNGEFSLSGKEIPEDLKGRFHSSRRLQLGDRKAYPKAKVLDQADERTLSDAVVHSIVIRPSPRDDDDHKGREYNKALIQIFKRLNTSGKALQPQEVRASIFHGPLLDLIQELNENADWRSLFGKKHSRMKDQEAITRALALFEDGGLYRSPMPKFLDNFMDEHRNISIDAALNLKLRFELAIRLIRSDIGDDALKRRGTFMLTRFDALVVGLMEALRADEGKSIQELEASLAEKLGGRNVKQRLEELEADNRGFDGEGVELQDPDEAQRGYNWSVAKFTNDTIRVKARLANAMAAFSAT